MPRHSLSRFRLPKLCFAKQDGCAASRFDFSQVTTDYKKSSVRGGMLTLTGQAFKFFLQIGSMFVLGRLLTPDDFGLVAMVTAITAFVLIFKDAGLSAAIIQQPDVTHEQVNTLFWVNVGISLLMTGVTAALAPVLVVFYKEPRLSGIVFAAAVTFLIGGLGVQHQALVSRQMRFKALAIVDSASMLISVVAAIVAALMGCGYWSLAIMQLALAASATILYWCACAWRPSAPELHPTAMPLLHLGKNLTGFSVINYFARNIDNVMIGRVWGPVQLGLYSKAYQILLLPLSQLNAPIQAVALPTLSRLVDEPERYRAGYCKAIRLLALAAMPLVGYMFVNADWLILTVLGAKWIAAADMYRWLSVAGLFQPVASSTGWLFMSQGRGRDMFVWSFIGGGLMVTSILGALYWGALAVAASYSLTSTFLVCPLLFWFVSRRGPIKMGDFYTSMMLPVYVTMVSAAGLWLFRRFVSIESPILGIGATVPLWLLLLVGALFLVPSGRATLSEVEALVRANLPTTFTRRRPPVVEVAAP